MCLRVCSDLIGFNPLRGLGPRRTQTVELRALESYVSIRSAAWGRGEHRPEIFPARVCVFQSAPRLGAAENALLLAKLEAFAMFQSAPRLGAAENVIVAA